MPVRRLQKTATSNDGVEKKPVILAFLQNPWFKKGTQQRHIDMYRDDPDFHRKVLSMSATGRALEKAFGEELYDHIIWDNASPKHGDVRTAAFPPDSVYMAFRIAQHNPQIILLFGRQAIAGWDFIQSCKDLEGLRIQRTVLMSAHPMAHGSSIELLRKISQDVKRLYDLKGRTR